MSSMTPAMAGFLSSPNPGLFCPKHSLQNWRRKDGVRAVVFAVPRKRRFTQLSTFMSGSETGPTHGPEESVQDIDSTEVQGPSQAPTRDGISTAGLSDGDAKFITACYNAEVGTIETMLEDGQDPKITDVNRRTALHFCAGNGLPTLCQKLIDAGADLNVQDVLGFTPLHMATGYKKLNTVQLLVDAGADANIASLKGDLAVEIAEGILEGTPRKKFFMANEEHSRIQSIVDILDVATELEEDDEDDDDDDDDDEAEKMTLTADGVREVTEETESAKYVVRVKPKGEASAVATPSTPASDVKVTIKVRDPKK